MLSKILICGDSFASNWYPTSKNLGWVNILEQEYRVTNKAQAGVSEYKIYKQLISEDLTRYDKVIVCHTSPYRIPISIHPIHKDSKIHRECDLIYNDVVQHKNNTIMNTAKEFYETIYDVEYFRFVNSLIVEKIKSLGTNIVNITFFDYYNDPGILNLSDIFKEHRGKVNHLSKVGNRIALSHIKYLLL